MNLTPYQQLGVAAVLLLTSAIFSGSETAMMSLNRYRTRHRARQGHRTARWAHELLSTPSELIGVVLIGNNLVNLLATALMTMAVIRLWGEDAVPWATLAFTLLVLIFAEVTPKTLAAQRPEIIAYPMSLPLKILLKLLGPLVWTINRISAALLWVIPKRSVAENEMLSTDELRTLVQDTGDLIPEQHQRMLLNILELDSLVVRDIMVPRQQIVGLDLALGVEHAMSILEELPYTELPVFREDIHNIKGVLHSRGAGRLMGMDNPTQDDLVKKIRPPYFVPDSVPLHIQLANFQREGKAMALVVDEHGDIQGLVTLEDILEEIVGEFDLRNSRTDGIHQQKDGSCYADGSAPVREVNRIMGWELPTSGSVTMSGLVTDHLQSFPEGDLCLHINGYGIETTSISDNTIKRMRIWQVEPAQSTGKVKAKTKTKGNGK